VFDILRHARMSLDNTRHAQALANSLWHSMRVDQAPDSKTELPDRVDETFFAHEDIRARPFAVLQLDENQVEENFAQLWFVDRIMENGGLWCGQYTKPWKRFGVMSEPEMPRETPKSESSKGKAPEKSSPDMSKQSIISRLTVFSMIASQVSVANAMSAETSETLVSRTSRYPLAFLAYFCGYPDYWNARGEERRSQNLISAFDVDGPCLVATPYNPDWEILPRPDLRSMSVCWVLESKSVAITSDEDKALDQMFWDNVWGGSVGSKEKGKEKALRSTTEEDDSMELKTRSRNENEDDAMPVYRVVRKVKGSWQMMDLPSQEYVFS
jgi:hypothetical protein